VDNNGRTIFAIFYIFGIRNKKSFKFAGQKLILGVISIFWIRQFLLAQRGVSSKNAIWNLDSTILDFGKLFEIGSTWAPKLVNL
jgi:hypothetical protein